MPLDLTLDLPATPVLVSQLVGGREALLSGNQWSPPPSHPAKMEESQQLFCPDWGSLVWRNDG